MERGVILMLTSFSGIFIFSFIIGIIYYKHKDIEKKDNLLSLVILLKGFFAVYLASIINNTGLSLLIAALGVIFGYLIVNRLILKTNMKFEYLFLGILLRFSPFIAGLCLLLFMLLYYFLKSRQISLLLTAVFLQISLYLLKRPDSLIILGFVILLTVFLQFILYLQKNKNFDTRIIGGKVF